MDILVARSSFWVKRFLNDRAPQPTEKSSKNHSSTVVVSYINLCFSVRLYSSTRHYYVGALVYHPPPKKKKRS